MNPIYVTRAQLETVANLMDRYNCQVVTFAPSGKVMADSSSNTIGIHLKPIRADEEAVASFLINSAGETI